MKTRDTILNLGGLVALVLLLWWADGHLGNYAMRILNLSAIYIVLALSLNLANGFTGLFSLGCAGFMAVGAYVSAILTMSPDVKDMNFFLEPLAPWLQNLTLPFGVALIAGGVCAAIAGLIVGLPVLRLRDDYLAIATLGFSESIRVVITNLQGLTNGAQGLKSIPKYSTTWAVWGVALLSIYFMSRLVRSSYGRQLKAVRDDEIAAALRAGYRVEAVPGACALIAALTASGLPTDEFHFLGFLPVKSGQRARRLENLKGVPGTLAFYESPYRIEKLLGALAASFPTARVVLARELSKKFEEFLRGSPAELLGLVRQRTLKGEFVVLVHRANSVGEAASEDAPQANRADP